jgi:UDP-glucose 4-epimerase
MNILVTGGAGFIGSHVVDLLIEGSHDVVILDNFSSGKEKNVNPKAKLVKMDIRAPNLSDVFETYQIQAVNHLAAQISVRNSVEDPAGDADINIKGIINVLECIKKHPLQKFVFSSSGGAVYGEAEVVPTDESYVPKPLSPYGIAKFTSEKYLYYYQQNFGLNYTALRYSNVFGPRQDPHGEAGVVAIFSQKMLKNETPTINGDGLQTRDYVFVKDVALANLMAVESEYSGEINIGTSIETNVNDLAEMIKKQTGYAGEINHAEAKLGEQKRSCLNISKAKQILNWKPKYNLTDGLKETVEYFKNN